MPKTIYTAIDPAGVEHKRTTADRTYTHTVVYQRSKVAAVEAATTKSARGFHAKNGQYYLDCIRDGRHENLMSFEHYRADTDRQARDVAEAIGNLAGATTAAEYAEAKVAAHLARIEATDWTIWHNLGWCGRHDLARKLAAKTSGAVILPAIQK
ncbi:hypothetical protein [Mesorhizobium sp. NZP2234]|uniref:hypothetical protein n=1 Tax=Mesorhizobium sp. NZP2234 TaxID=2483402 RepID=UPI0015558949|nr:hypothetical protein [Mesorhizobium sp. NZP2234]